MQGSQVWLDIGASSRGWMSRLSCQRVCHLERFCWQALAGLRRASKADNKTAGSVMDAISLQLNAHDQLKTALQCFSP